MHMAGNNEAVAIHPSENMSIAGLWNCGERNEGRKRSSEEIARVTCEQGVGGGCRRRLVARGRATLGRHR